MKREVDCEVWTSRQTMGMGAKSRVQNMRAEQLKERTGWLRGLGVGKKFIDEAG